MYIGYSRYHVCTLIIILYMIINYKHRLCVRHAFQIHHCYCAFFMFVFVQRFLCCCFFVQHFFVNMYAYILPRRSLYKCYLIALITRAQTADMVICRSEGGMPYMFCLVTCQVKVAVSLVSDSVVKLE